MTAPRVPTDVRWDCGGCTACCRHFSLGPVSDRIVQGLHNNEVHKHWAPAADGFAVKRPGPTGTAWYFTRRADGACVFLQDDGLCAIHARWGADAKPAFCREYPFTTVEFEGELRMYVRSDCGGWAKTFESGDPIEAQAVAVAALDHQHPVGKFTMDPIPLWPGVGIGPEQWAAVESHLAPIIEDDTQPVEQTFRAAASLISGFVRRPLPEPDAERLHQAIAMVAQQIEALLAPAVAQPPNNDADTIGMIAFLSQVLKLVRQAQSRPDRELDERARRYVGVVLRSQLHGLAFQALGGIPGWIGIMAIGIRIAARNCEGDGPVHAPEFGEHLATWVRLTRHTAARRLMQDLRPVLDEVFLKLG